MSSIPCPVVEEPLLPIRQDAIGIVELLSACVRCPLIRVAIWMMKFRQCTIRSVNNFRLSMPLDT